MKRRVSVEDEKSQVGAVLPIVEKDVEHTYYQVAVGSYGVVVPRVINSETLDGLQLVDGKGSMIGELELAKRIAEKTSGKLLEVEERFIRTITIL